MNFGGGHKYSDCSTKKMQEMMAFKLWGLEASLSDQKEHDEFPAVDIVMT